MSQYIATAKKRAAAAAVPAALEPDWASVAKHDLAKVTVGDRFAYRDKALLLSPVEDERLGGAIRAALGQQQAFASWKVLDVAELARDHGGSGGLKRYWALVDDRGKRTVLELKAAAEPAVNELGSAREPAMNKRLSLLKQAFWGTDPADDFVYVQVEGQRYLARDRLAMKSVDLAALKRGERERVLLAQASYMAEIHADAWKDVSEAQMFEWLKTTTKTLAKRWQAVFDDAR